MKKNKQAIYPGTFDPLTKGHLDIIERSLKAFDTLIVAVAEDSVKDSLFTVEEKIEIIKKETEKYKGKIKVESFKGLTTMYAEKKKVNVIIRGLRAMSDFEYEMQMALSNRELAPNIETFFLMTSEKYSHISSRFIKDIARLGGELKKFVTPNVAKKLKNKFKGK